MAGDHPDDKIVSFKKDEPFQLQLLSTMRYFTELFIFGLFSEISAVFINPYSYGSYDPAAENPQTYQYYARYFNPNPHNPYAPYPTHMKPGRFTLPRMYQIDPAYASRYPPNYAETLPYATYPQQQQGKHSPRRRNNLNLSRGRESVAVFPDGCGQSSQSSGNEGGNQAIFGQYRRRPSNSIRRSMRIKGRSHRRSQGGGRRRFYPKSETELLLDRLDGKNGGGTKRKITPPTPKKPKPQPKSETQLLLERLDRGGGVRPTPNGNGRGIQPKSETQLLLERLDGGGGWGTPKSETQLLLERLDAGSNVFVTGNAYSSGISKNKYGRPRWIDTQPSPDVTAKFAASSGVVRPRLRVDYQRNTPLVNFPQDYEANRSRRPKYPESSEATSSEQTSSEEAEASVEVEAPAPADTERLPLDRISETNTRAPTKAEKKEKVDDVFSQISEGRTLRAVKRVRHL